MEDKSTTTELKIHQQLYSWDLGYLKFLCEWEMPDTASRLECVERGHDLFAILRERGKTSSQNLSFLASLLNCIGREDLASLIPCELAVSPALECRSTNPSYLFAKCLVSVARCLKTEDRKHLLFFLRPKLQVPGDWEPATTTLFLKLKEKLLLTETNTRLLHGVLCEINRLDLAVKLNQFLMSTGQQPHDIETDQGWLHVATAQVYSIDQICAKRDTASGSTTVDGAIQARIKENIRALEMDFYDLTNCIEGTLTKQGADIKSLTAQFGALPQSIRRLQEPGEQRVAIRREVLASKTIKEFFDNVTKLKQWSYMTPDILTFIIQHLKYIHYDVAVYESKLLSFKQSTKLKDVIGLEFLIPDYYMELIAKVRGWQEKTIYSAEKSIQTLLVKAGYRNTKLIGGFQGVKSGCIELVLVLLESVDTAALSTKELVEAFRFEGILSIVIDHETIFSEEEQADTSSAKGATMPQFSADHGMSSRHELWHGSGSLAYAVQGGRDVLIIESDTPLDDPTAVPRIPYSLTEEDKYKLKGQGVFSDYLDEATIIRLRYELDKRRILFRVLKSDLETQLSREQVMKSIEELFTSTKNDGVIVYYIGAGRRNTGDWCFQDGFITFKDITQLYLRLIKGQVLTIVSDCSYSGRWVRDCMEFLDEKGVQPCGHKAREKGMLIKVYASCRPVQVPTQYQFSVHGAANDKNTRAMFSYTSKQLLEKQHTYSLNSSIIRCDKDKKIEDKCELPTDFTWQDWRVKERIGQIIHKPSSGPPSWHYVLLSDDEDKLCDFRNKEESGLLTESGLHAIEYERVLKSDFGTEPPNEVKDEMESCAYLLSLAESLSQL